MLQNLHVKNLALIDEVEVDFGPGLNILTGETGAGKSIILGSVNLALGGRYNADMLRKGARFGLVELMFSIENQELIRQLEEMDIFPEDGMLILSRKLMEGRSVSKINGETVTMGVLRDVASLLIDIHEQHEHQRLLNKRNHLTFLDVYAKEQVEKPKQKMALAYRAYQEYSRRLEASGMEEKERRKEIDLTEYELHEIESAHLRMGEDEDLESLYQRMTQSKDLTSAVAQTYQYTSEDDRNNARRPLKPCNPFPSGSGKISMKKELHCMDSWWRLTVCSMILTGNSRSMPKALNFQKKSFMRQRTASMRLIN